MIDSAIIRSLIFGSAISMIHLTTIWKDILTMQALIDMQSSKPLLTSTLPLPTGVNASLKPAIVQRKAFLKKGNRMIANPRAGEKTMRMVSTAPARDFKQEATYILCDYHLSFTNWDVIQRIRTFVAAGILVELALSIDFYFPTLNKRRDEDGGIKAVQDVIFNHLELDDCMVVDLHVRKFEDPARPRTEVELFVAAGR
jgi:hypothetical protein